MLLKAKCKTTHPKTSGLVEKGQEIVMDEGPVPRFYERLDPAPPVKAAMTLEEAARLAVVRKLVTKDGKPTVEAIEQILGRGITAAERDKAVEALSLDFV